VDAPAAAGQLFRGPKLPLTRQTEFVLSSGDVVDSTILLESRLPLDNTIAIHNLLVVNQLDATFAALADSTRRAMVIKLTLGPASIHDLTEPFSLSQQMISKHVACLVRAQFVVKQRRGRVSICTLRPTAIKAVADWALDFRRLWEESFDKLDAVLQKMKNEETTHGKSSNR
jgi:DNA-binding transcriptional ArsR family regulator